MTLECNYIENAQCDYCGSKDTFASYERRIGSTVRECEKCGFAYLSPRPKTTFMKDYYKEQYAADNVERMWEDYRSLDWTRFDIARLRRATSIKGSVVLDVGCGSGIFLDALRRAGASKLVGIELNKKKALFAAKMLESASIYSGSYEDIKLPCETINIVVAMDVIEHLYEPRKFFRYVAQRVKPGGIFYVRTPNWNAVKRYGGDWIGLHQDAEHVCYFSRFSLNNFLSSNGFSLVSFDYEPATYGFGVTGACATKQCFTEEMLKRLNKIRYHLRNSSALSKKLYRLTYLVRRVKNRKDIRSETAHELVAIYRKS